MLDPSDIVIDDPSWVSHLVSLPYGAATFEHVVSRCGYSFRAFKRSSLRDKHPTCLWCAVGLDKKRW